MKYIQDNLGLPAVLANYLIKTKKIEKFTEMVDSQYFYQNEPDKPCFQDDMAYGEFKDLPLKNGF